MTDNLIIAIDGPVGSGKSTVARNLAKQAGFAYLDTGAMYRAIGWKAYTSKINLTNEDLDRLCSETQLDMELENGHLKVSVDGKDVSSEIRTPEISRMASVVSAFASVRIHLVRMQREIGQSWAKRYGGVVVEGRDIGTVV
ncbi:MAG: (d)CMP kinase, partial [Nitrospira sp.]|nr:(d)CMP kinase [Nitrospira sp.]